MAEKALLLYGDDGIRLLLAADALRIAFDVIDGRRALHAEIKGEEFLAALVEVLRENPGLLMEQRSHSCGYYGCDSISVPDRSLIADMLLAIREALARAPRPRQAEDEDGSYWIWSPDEEAAARKAAILLDLAAMILRHPEAASKLPEDVEMLVKRHEEGTLFQYLQSDEKKAEVKG